MTTLSVRCCVTLWAVRKFELSKRHSMEFKITKEKTRNAIKCYLLFFNRRTKIYTPCLVSVVLLAHFIVFRGLLGVCNSCYKQAQVRFQSEAALLVTKTVPV